MNRRSKPASKEACRILVSRIPPRRRSCFALGVEARFRRYCKVYVSSLSDWRIITRLLQGSVGIYEITYVVDKSSTIFFWEKAGLS